LSNQFSRGFQNYWTPFNQQSSIVSKYVPLNGVVLYGNIGRVGIAALDAQILDSVGLVTPEFAKFRKTGEIADALDLLKKYPPDLIIIGIGDSQLLSLVAKLPNIYVERDWLTPQNELLLIRKNLLLKDDSPAIDPRITEMRNSLVFDLIGRDEFIDSVFDN
jgi:hypothetical protein